MRIKQITVLSIPPAKNKSYKKSDTFFDIAGNKIEYVEYKKGKIETWEKFMYDEQNTFIEKIIYTGNSYNPNDFKPTSTKFKYDAKGILITGESQIDENDDNGQKTVISFYLNGSIKNRRYFNKDNLCVRDDTFGKGNVIKRILYNETGQILEIHNFRSDGFALKYTINSYNGHGQLIRVKSVSKRRNEIPDLGLRVGDEYFSEDRLLKYSEEGLLIEDIDHPVDFNNAFADVLDSSNGYSHKYFYTAEKLLEQENLYLCGNLVMVYRFSYQFW